MSQILEQPKQQTRKFSDILRHTKFKQCYREEANEWIQNDEPQLQERCAIGVLMTEFFGVDYANDSPHIKQQKRQELMNILIQHGLLTGDIIVRNDHQRQSFSQIADFLEAHGL